MTYRTFWATALGMSLVASTTPIALADYVVGSGQTQTFNTAIGQSQTISDGTLVRVDGAVRAQQVRGNGQLTGNGGNLNVNAPLIIINGSVSADATQAGGNGGVLNFNTGNGVLVNNGTISARGVDGGQILFTTGSFTLGQNGVIDASGNGGRGGYIGLNASGVVDIRGKMSVSGASTNQNSNNLIEIQGAGVTIASTAVINALGDKGAVSINSTGNLSNRGTIAVDGAGSETAGSIVLTATGNIDQGGNLQSKGGPGSVSLNAGGEIAFDTGSNITVENGSFTANAGTDIVFQNSNDHVAVSANNGGSIQLVAAEDVIMDATRLEARGGTISVNANYVQLGDKSTLSTSTLDGSDAGDITINANGDINIVARTDSATLAANGGKGGNITVAAQGSLGIKATSDSPTFVIEANGENGQGGSVAVSGSQVVFQELNTANQRGFARANGTTNGGSVTVAGDTLDLTRGKIEANGANNAGDIALTTTNDMVLLDSVVEANGDNRGNVALTSTAGVVNLKNSSVGINGGALSQLTVNSGSHIIQTGGELFARGTDAAGSVNLTFANGSTANIYRVDANSSNGNAGDITITGGSMVLTQANSFVRAIGGDRAGNVTTNLTGSFNQAVGTDINTRGRTVGNASNTITLNAASITTDGQIVATGARAGDNGGTITLNATNGNLITKTNSVIAASGSPQANAVSGQGGTVTLNASKSIAVQGDLVANGNQGQNAGTINVNATTAGGNVYIINGGKLQANSLAGPQAGNGGTVNINAAQHITVTQTTADTVIEAKGNSALANTGNGGQGGNVTFNAGGTLVFSNTSGSPTRYVDVSGGTGNGAGNSGGNGGTITSTSTTLRINQNDVNAFTLKGGTGINGAVNGTDGVINLD